MVNLNKKERPRSTFEAQLVVGTRLALSQVSNLDKLIHLAMWTNTFRNFYKYVKQIEQIGW